MIGASNGKRTRLHRSPCSRGRILAYAFLLQARRRLAGRAEVDAPSADVDALDSRSAGPARPRLPVVHTETAGPRRDAFLLELSHDRGVVRRAARFQAQPWKLERRPRERVGLRIGKVHRSCAM